MLLIHKQLNGAERGTRPPEAVALRKSAALLVRHLSANDQRTYKFHNLAQNLTFAINSLSCFHVCIVVRHGPDQT
jgi:hypothetical protein